MGEFLCLNIQIWQCSWNISNLIDIVSNQETSENTNADTGCHSMCFFRPFIELNYWPFHHILINLNVLIKCVNMYLFLNESCTRFQLQTSPEYGQGMNPISRLAQIQQAKKEKEPEYALVTERGLPRRREFVMQVLIREKILFSDIFIIVQCTFCVKAMFFWPSFSYTTCLSEMFPEK